MLTSFTQIGNCLLLSVLFISLVACSNEEEPEPSAIFEGEISYQEVAGSYTTKVLDIGFDLRVSNITAVATTLLDEVDYDITYKLLYTGEDIDRFNWTPAELPGEDNISRIRFADLEPGSSSQVLIYFVSDRDTLINTFNIYTCSLDPIGYENKFVNSGGQLEVVNLHIPESELAHVSFYLGEELLSVSSFKVSESNSYRCETSSVILDLPEFDSTEARELYATYNGYRLHAHLVSYEWQYGSKRLIFLGGEHLITPSDWKLLNTPDDNKIRTTGGITENDHYLERNGVVYFYGNSLNQTGYGLYTLNLISNKTTLLIEDERMGQHLSDENGVLYRYALDQGKITKSLVNTANNSYELVSEDYLEEYRFDEGFFDKGYFYGKQNNTAYKIALLSRNTTVINSQLPNLGSMTDIHYLQSYVLGIQQSGLYQLVTIYDPVADTREVVVFSYANEGAKTFFEYEGSIYAGEAGQVLFKLDLDRKRWEEVNKFSLALQEYLPTIETSPFYLPSQDEHIFLAGESVYQFSPLSVD
ncbi:MAG: hypothetical protein WBA74_25215 [Cyclobacteriaceae bacterium]